MFRKLLKGFEMAEAAGQQVVYLVFEQAYYSASYGQGPSEVLSVLGAFASMESAEAFMRLQEGSAPRDVPIDYEFYIEEMPLQS